MEPAHGVKQILSLSNIIYEAEESLMPGAEYNMFSVTSLGKQLVKVTKV